MMDARPDRAYQLLLADESSGMLDEIPEHVERLRPESDVVRVTSQTPPRHVKRERVE